METVKHSDSIYTHTKTDALLTDWCFPMCYTYKPEVSNIAIFIIFLP